MTDWKAWSSKLSQVGPSNFYSPTYFSDYFPGYLYILWGIGVLFNFLNLSISSLNFEIVIKSITAVFDVLTAFYIYKIILKHNKALAKTSFVLYLLNPAVIFNSSIWGQIDGIFTFFLLLSAYLLFDRKEIFKSSTAVALGILIKPQSLAFIPIFFVHLLKNFSKERIIKSLLLVVLFLLILSFPFFPKNPILGLFELGNKSQNVYQYTSLFAFNFWGTVGFWKPDSSIFILSYKMWGIILYAISLLLICAPLFRRKINREMFYMASSLSLFSFFLFLTRIHERYLFPFFAFILIASILRKSRVLFTIYVISSIVHFINLWFVYYYYNYVYQSPALSKNIFFSLVNDNYKFFSFLMLLLFIVILVYYFKFYVEKIHS